jgi:hypothetical protein
MLSCKGPGRLGCPSCTLIQPCPSQISGGSLRKSGRCGRRRGAASRPLLMGWWVGFFRPEASGCSPFRIGSGQGPSPCTPPQARASCGTQRFPALPGIDVGRERGATNGGKDGRWNLFVLQMAAKRETLQGRRCRANRSHFRGGRAEDGAMGGGYRGRSGIGDGDDLWVARRR